MGRVSRYKKVKSCDPYSKKNKGNVDLTTVGVWGLGDNGRRVKKKSLTVQRIKKANELRRNNRLAKTTRTAKSKHVKKDACDNNDGFDLPYHEDEFDMNDLVGSVKKQKVEDEDNNDKNGPKATAHADPVYTRTVTKTGVVASIPKTDDDEKKVTRLLKLDQQIESKLEETRQETYKRMDGESKRAYNKRTKIETRHIIQQTKVQKNVEKLQKKKEFLNNKKKNKKRKNMSSSHKNGGIDDDDEIYNNDRKNSSNDAGFITGERAIAASAAAVASRTTKKSVADDPVLFGEQAERPPSFKHLPRGAVDKKKNKALDSNGSTRKAMTKDQIHAEQDAMELMRRKIQAQYAMIKSKRRQAGDFHL